MERQAAGPLRILYVGWVGFGNLGDDACRDLFIQSVHKAAAALGRETRVRTVTHQGISEQALLEFEPHLVVLGAGSLFTPAYLEPLLLAQRHGIPTATWGTGIDKLPARHVEALLAGKNASRAWIGEHAADLFRRAVAGCAWAGVRGPHTRRVLMAAGCPDPPLHVCGDPGLLLQPDASGFAAAPANAGGAVVQPADGSQAPASGGPGGPGSAPRAPAGQELLSPRLKDWIAARAPIVAVNWGTANNNVFGGNEQRTAYALKAAIERLAGIGYNVLLFGVWGPDLSPLRRLAARFDANPSVTLLNKVPPAPLLAWILQSCRFSVNFKLHANVFTAAAGRPFISLAYRSKCYDFAASVGCSDLVVRFDDPDLVEAVVHRSVMIERKRKRIEERIARHKRKYARRLEALLRNFAALGDPANP